MSIRTGRICKQDFTTDFLTQDERITGHVIDIGNGRLRDNGG